MTSLLLAGPKAHAGTYTGANPIPDTSPVAYTPYSGGTMTDTGHDSSYPPPIFESNTGYGAFTHVYVSTPNQCSITVSGPLNATYTWNPDPSLPPAADPPPSAIITQNCYLVWNTNSAQDGATGSGSGTSGLPGKVAFLTGPSGGGSVTGYSVASPSGSTISASCSPTLNYMGQTTDASRSVVYADATVNYSANVYPITVSLGGTTLVNGTEEVLTGQPITASLGTPNGLPSGTTITSYKWDIESSEGGSLVGGYLAQQAQGMTFAPASFSNPTITFYDGIADTVMVNLIVGITFPDGTTDTGTATTQVTVVKPTVTNHHFKIMEADTFTSDPNNVGPRLGAEESWADVAISMPPGFSGGSGCFAQILQSTSEDDTRHTGTDYTIKEKLSNGQWVPIPAPCLDTDFPYPYASVWTVGASGPGGVGMGGDDPFFPVSPPLNSGDPGKPDWYKASGRDQFLTWVMYNPNPQSGNNIWVPLSNFDWNWNNTASLDTSVTPQMWRTGTFTGDEGLDFAPAVKWPDWNTWIPFTIINYMQTGTVAMHE